MDRAEHVGQLLLARGWRIGVAESTAGGLISAALLKVPGASRYYERGVVAYSRAAKIDPFHPQVWNAGFARLPFDQMIFFHDQ